jgi:Na+-driven multidrug efflux pump
MYEYKGRLMNGRVNAFYFPGLIAALSITASMFLDIAVVGQMLGPVAMGAVNLALPLTMVFNMVYMLLGIGGEVLVSAAKGAGNKAEANKLFSVAMLTIIAISIVLMLVGLSAGKQVAVALSRGDGDMELLVAQYIHVMFIAAPLMIGVTSMTYFVKVDALPKLAAGVMVFTNVVSLISKVIYLGPLQLGIAGAAFGTITGFVAGFLLLVPYLFFRKRRTLAFVSLSIKDFRRLGNIIIAGLPPALGQGLGAITTFCTNLVILDVAGKSGIIVVTVCSSISIFISSFRYAATSAMVPIVGALFGERDWWSMHQVAMRITKIVMGCVAASIILIEIFPDRVLSFFGVHDLGVMGMGITALRIYAIGLVLSSITYILMTYMQTTSRKIFSIAISAGTEILAVIFVYLLGYWWGNIGLWSHNIAAQLVLLLLIILTAKYIGKKSNGKYCGIFIHEVRPDFVRGNSIYATQEEAAGYTDMIGKFLADNQVPQQVSVDTKELIYKIVMEIVEKEKNPQKTIDIMALVYDGYIRIRLRDDSGEPEAMKAETDERISRLSAMGYNNTYIKVPVY